MCHNRISAFSRNKFIFWVIFMVDEHMMPWLARYTYTNSDHQSILEAFASLDFSDSDAHLIWWEITHLTKTDKMPPQDMQ